MMRRGDQCSGAQRRVASVAHAMPKSARERKFHYPAIVPSSNLTCLEAGDIRTNLQAHSTSSKRSLVQKRENRRGQNIPGGNEDSSFEAHDHGSHRVRPPRASYTPRSYQS